jgi:glutamine synthetase type III
MADTLKKFKSEVDTHIEKGDKKEIAIMHVLRQYIVASEKVLFEGDGYSEAWQKEAEKRGLPNVKTYASCFGCNDNLTKQKNFLKIMMYTLTGNWKQDMK